MSEWLEETQEGLDPMIDILEKHKKAPLQAIRTLQAYSATLDNSTRELFEKVSRMDESSAAMASASAAAREAQTSVKKLITPPSSNTGGKFTKTFKKSGGTK
jgi:hypothetical protein